MKYCACVVTFNHVIESIKTNINAIVFQVQILYKVDTCSSNVNEIRQVIFSLDSYDKIILLSGSNNKKIATVLNIACQKTFSEGYGWIGSLTTINNLNLVANVINRIKLIQYMNLKKPIVASDISVNREIVDDCGITTNTKEDWCSAIEFLLMHEIVYEKKNNHIKYDFCYEIFCENNFKKIISILNGGME